MHPVTRRTMLTATAGAAAMLVVGRTGGRAQMSTPVASPGLEGYPVLAVTITDDGFALASTSVPAGKVRFVLTNTTSEWSGAAVLGPAEGQSMADLEAAAATPVGDDGFPPFLYTATILGGPQDVPPGETKEALLDIPAGDWVVFSDITDAASPFTAVESGESNTDEPAADAEIVFGDFYFGGLDAITAGQQLWKVTNEGVQPHMLVLTGVPAGTTIDQVMTTLTGEESGTPVAGALDPNDIQDLSEGVLLLSAGKMMWLPITLDAGTYVGLCFVTDPNTGQPHMMEGMAQVFTVS